MNYQLLRAQISVLRDYEVTREQHRSSSAVTPRWLAAAAFACSCVIFHHRTILDLVFSVRLSSNMKKKTN